MNPTYTYKDISLVPRKLSTIHSRDDVDLSQEISNINKTTKLSVSLPIIPSPMETIATIEMATKLDSFGIWNAIHRFQSKENRLNIALSSFTLPPLVSIGVGEKEFDIIEQLIRRGCKFFNIDIANGFNSIIEPTIAFIRNLCPDSFIMGGNFASREGFKYLSDLGIDCARAGVGNGSVCSTSQKTSIGQGVASSVIEAVQEREKIHSKSLILADGGMSNPGDIGKALGLGADLVMIGSMFAGTKESGGEVIKYNDQKFKIYRGSASYGAQAKTGRTPKFVEGGETLVKYKSGGVAQIIYDIENGLKSTLSYMGAKNLKEFRENAKNNFVVYNLDKKLF